MSYIDKADDFVRSLGIEAYRVGGSVRDELKGLKPKDADYMVRGVSLEKLHDVLDRAQARGIRPIKLRQGGQFGWRCQAPNGAYVEISLPRTEVSDGPGRAMRVKVDPDLSLIEDARRRDFTFNALYRPIMEGYNTVTDPTSAGLFDLERGYIRTTHEDSFADDPLRMLRALRFVARGFDLAMCTEEQMIKHASEVDGLTARGHTSGTLPDELRKILEGRHAAEALRIARDTGVLAVAIPELAPMIGFEQGSKYHDMTTDEHTFVALDEACKFDAPLRVRFALLFHDSGKPATAWIGPDGHKHYYANDGTDDHADVGVRIWREFCARVNAGRDLREDVATLIKHHMLTAGAKGPRVRRMRVKLGDDMLQDLIVHRTCDILGKGKPNRGHLKNMLAWADFREDAAAKGVPASVKGLEVSGKDALDRGLSGSEIGLALRAVLDEVVVRPDAQTMSREWQLKRLLEFTA